MFAGLATNIQNRRLRPSFYCIQYQLNSQKTAANAQIEQQLHASSGDISLSLSLFILVQGNCPIIWSAISEIKGRKVCIHSCRQNVIY